MCSIPPARTTSAAPIAISPAPAVTAVSAPAHIRSTAKPGTRRRQPREQRDVAAERQALIADLRGRRQDDVVDPLGRQGRVAAQQLADDLDAQVVGARAPEDAFRPGPAEGGADAVDVENLAQLAHVKDPSQSSHSRHTPVTDTCARARYDRVGEEVGCA